MACLRVP
jgi:hypothetical protein